MTPEEFEPHRGIIFKSLNRYFERFHVPNHDREIYEVNALSAVWTVWEKAEDPDALNSAYLWKVVFHSCVDTFSELQSGRNGVKISLFSETSEFSENFDPNYTVQPVYVINGDDFPNLPGMADLSEDDLTVVREFMNTPVEDRSRRTNLRRQVDFILRTKLGIDSADVHEYTARNRRNTSGT